MIPAVAKPYVYIGAAVVGVVAAMKLIGARNIGKAAGAVFADAIGGVVEGADAFVSEGVQGTGEVLGIPRTDTEEAALKCRQAMASGDFWGASAYCPAPTFGKWVATGMPSGGATGDY